jgi:tripartite ATP-independent transporter DctM subunit
MTGSFVYRHNIDIRIFYNLLYIQIFVIKTNYSYFGGIVTESSNHHGKIYGFLRSIVGQISRVFNAAAIVILVLMTLLILADIILRYLFYQPVIGSTDLLGFMAGSIVFLALAQTAFHNGHISLELLISRFSPRSQAAIKSITVILCLGVFAVITWQSVVYALELQQSGQTFPVLSVPIFPFLYIMAFGSAVLCLVFIFHLIKYLSAVKKRSSSITSLALLLLIVIVVAVFTIPFWGLQMLSTLSPDIIGVLCICVLIVLFFSGVPSAIAMILVGLLGMAMLGDISSNFQYLASISYNMVFSYVFAVIPLFLLMTALVQQSGIMQSVYLASTTWFGRLCGGAALSALLAGIFNSFACASSQSNIAAAGSASIPKMLRVGQNSGSASGTVTASGVVTLLIPPGIGLIIYAMITQLSIIKTFMAALIPGVVLSVLFVLYILIAGWIKPEAFPKQSLNDEKQSVIGFIVLIPLGIWVLPFMGMLMGIFTPTEAAAVAVLIAVVMAVVWAVIWQKPVFSVLRKSLLQAVKSACAIGLILIGIGILNQFFSAAGLIPAIAGTVGGLEIPPFVIKLCIFLIYIVIGCFIEPLTMLVLSLPFIFPAIISLGYDPVLFGIIFMLLAGIGMILSPYFINLSLSRTFVPTIRRRELILGSLPFAAITVIVLILVTAFPSIALWLPNLLYQ